MKMKKRNVKYVLAALSLIAFVFTANSWAEDITAAAKFMALCTESPFAKQWDNYEPSCCDLMLKNYSDGQRGGVKRRLPDFERKTETYLKKILKIPGMTNEKIDAVCNLYDSAEEQSRLGELARGAGDNEGYHSYQLQSRQLQEQSQELFLSYVSGVNSSGTLSASNFCRSRNQLNQMKKDLKDDDGKLFPSVKRDLESNALRVYQMIYRETNHLECRRKQKTRIEESAKTIADAEQAKTRSGRDSQAQVMTTSGPERSEAKEQKSDSTKPSADIKKGYESVYEKCVSQPKLSREFDCECLAQKVVAMHSKQRPGYPLDDLLISDYARRIYVDGSCRNIPDTSRLEYENCMRGSGFDDYRGIPQKDYCECYADTWGKFYGEYEGRIDENRKSSIRFKARSYCYKPEAYK